MDAAVKDQFTDHKDQSAEHKEQPNDRSLPKIPVKPPTQVCVSIDLILSPFLTKSSTQTNLLAKSSSQDQLQLCVIRKV
jgi:hypothetical protein